VILSNRKVEGGIEVVAAVDWDDDHESWEETPSPERGGEGLDAFASGPPPRATVPASAPRRAGATSVRAAGASSRGEAREGRVAAGEIPGGAAALAEEVRALRDLLEREVAGLAWGDAARREPLRAALLAKLLGLGLVKGVADPIAAEAKAASAPGEGMNGAWRRALTTLATRVEVTGDDILSDGGVVALLGPTGAGKTTTVAKLAARYRMRHGTASVAMITTDNFRVGAEAQLRTFGRLMEVPVASCADAAELESALGRFRDRGLVLVDTAGMGQRDARLPEQAAIVRSGAGAEVERLRCYLVLAAPTEYGGLDETVEAYGAVPLAGAVVTKADEATSLGGVLSVLVRHHLPAADLSDGQRVPEDLAPARGAELVRRAVSLARARPRQETGREGGRPAFALGGLVAHG
jgi:flagellar biosynthesis protein FlhF